MWAENLWLIAESTHLPATYQKTQLVRGNIEFNLFTFKYIILFTTLIPKSWDGVLNIIRKRMQFRANKLTTIFQSVRASVVPSFIQLCFMILSNPYWRTTLLYPIRVPSPVIPLTCWCVGIKYKRIFTKLHDIFYLIQPWFQGYV